MTDERRELFETFREVIREYTYQPFGQAEAQELCSRLTDAALVRAEAGVSAAVEALADVRARRSTFATAEAFDSAMLEAAWNILAARSAKENDHD